MPLRHGVLFFGPDGLKIKFLLSLQWDSKAVRMLTVKQPDREQACQMR